MQSLVVDSIGSTVTWLLGGSSPALTRVIIEGSCDGLQYTSLAEGIHNPSVHTLLGEGHPIVGGWSLTGLSLPHNQNFWIRARGFTPTGYFNSSECNVYLQYSAFLLLIVR